MYQLEKTDSQTPKAYLIPYPVESFSKPILIESTRTFIGRSPEGGIQIQINDRRISRKHACIHCENSHFFIEDLDSQNGTYLNQTRITKAPLKSHDKISIGNRTYLFLVPPDLDGGSRTGPSMDESATIAISLEEMDLSAIWAQNAEHAARGFLQHDADNPSDTPPRDSLAHQRLSLLYQLSENLSTAGRTRDVYAKSLELVMEAIPAAEFALVAKKSTDDEAFEIVSLKLRDPQQVEGDAIPISQTVFDWVLTEKVTLVTQNLGEDQRFEGSESIRIHDLRSIICVPISGKQKVLGLLYAQANNLLNPFTKEDAKFVSAVANEMALNIDNLRLQRNMLRNERMAAIGITVSDLAHNIKNLLAVNQVAIQLMDSHIKENDFTHIEKKWKWIKDSLDGIGKLSTDMLEYAKEDELFLKTVDVNKLILGNRQTFEDSQSRDGLEFEYALTDQKTLWAIDAIQLQQALLNLVLNAADALKESQNGRILISTAVRNQCNLLIRVADNGCGIPEKDKPKVLDLFFTTKGSRGTGLGLSMVQKFVEKSGGQLKFQSEEGQGSVFTMIFPKRIPRLQKTAG
jgi:signal transduction histidine kinase